MRNQYHDGRKSGNLGRHGPENQEQVAKIRRGHAGPQEKFGERELLDGEPSRPTYRDSRGTKPLYPTVSEVKKLLGIEAVSEHAGKTWIIHIPAGHTEKEVRSALRKGNYELMAMRQVVHVSPLLYSASDRLIAMSRIHSAHPLDPYVADMNRRHYNRTL